MRTPVKAPPTNTPALSAAPSLALQRKCACVAGAPACESCQAEEAKKKQEETKQQSEKTGQRLQRAAAGASPPPVAPPSVHSVLSSPGRPLDPPARSFMESRFGRDFSAVRIHTDAAAADSARAVNAHAYTVGQHIVFDRGHYAPETGGGRHLLAHELAHTVQQHGLQRSSDQLPMGETPEYRRLEREADTAAQSALAGHGPLGLTTPASQPTVSRAPKKTAESTPPTNDADPDRDWQPVSPGSKLGKLKVKQKAKPAGDANKAIMAFNMGTLDLPAEKGKVEKAWQDRAAAGGLEAIMEPGEGKPRTKAGLKQDRPPTSTLRDIWRQRVGWTAEDANQKWKSAGGDKASFDPPQAGKKTCQVDHVVELQFGGSNVKENMQMLDGPENQESGRELFAYLRTTSEAIRDVVNEDNPKPKISEILLHFDGVTQSAKPICGPCCAVDAKAPSLGTVGEGESVGGAKGEPFAISSGGSETNILIPQDLVKDKKKTVDVKDSPIPENKSASTLISGLLLNQLRRDKGTLSAVIDTGSKLPVTMDNEKGVDLHVAKDGKLTLPAGRKNLKFHYGFLSEGVFTELKIEADRTISGRGTIKPSIPFLKSLDVVFDKDRFALLAPLDAKKLNPPIPGAKITQAEIGLELAPQFKPTGTLAFELATGPKKLLDGKIDLSADATGLVADGVIHVFLPGVDNAEGTIKYQNKEWSGGVKIETTQLQNKLKYVKSGSVVVSLTKQGIGATGTVMLDIPHTDGVEASLIYHNKKWLLRGKGTFNPPKLKPVTIGIEYDGDHIEGSAETGFEFHGLQGKLKVVYRDERFSGEGTIDIAKGRAKGKLHVKMRPGPKFSGEGEVSYQITENLIAKAGIEIDEQEHVRLKGALEFPKPIPLFQPIKGDYKIFEIGVSIPIPGASIGPIGLKARIEGALSAGYQIGPGELRNAKIEAAFNPLDDKPDVDVTIGAQLYIGAEAHISGSISGGIEVDAGIASLTGGLTVTATASLAGHVASQVTVHYTKSRLEATADFEAMLGLALRLALDAFVRAKAGIGPFSVETKKVWNLAAINYDTGLKLGMKLKKPIRYVSDGPLELPSVDDIEWITPKIDTQDVLKKSFAGGGKEEES